MSARATGPFDVNLGPLPAYDETPGAPIGRRSIDKTFRGDLAATSRGEMLAAVGHVQGSAGYVAMELVSGSLHGRTGTFVLQHSSTLDRGTPAQRITVVPDSATGELAGLSGTMTIVIEGGRHSYEFDYTLPA